MLLLYPGELYRLLGASSCLNLTSFPTFLTLQDKHNIRTLSLNVKCVLAAKQAWKARRRLAILPVSKARTNTFYIYRQIFVLHSTGFELTPLIHCSTIRLALRPAPSTTSNKRYDCRQKGAVIIHVICFLDVCSTPSSDTPSPSQLILTLF